MEFQLIFIFLSVVSWTKCNEVASGDQELNGANSTDWNLNGNQTNTTDKQSKVNNALTFLKPLNYSVDEEFKSLILDNAGIIEMGKGFFKDLPGSFQNMTVTRNDIRIIEEGIFNNLTILKLNMSHNKIQRIMPKAFDNMTHLTSIILDNNEIITYNFHFMNCPKLKLISLRYNFIKELPEGLFRSLKDNTLTVKFSYNTIKEVHKLAFDIKEFREVYLDHNELQNAKLLIKLVKAEKVDLSNNRIDCLPKEFMENGLSKIKILNITDNPLNCSCLHDLRKKVRKNVEFQKMSPLVQNINIILPEKDCSK